MSDSLWICGSSGGQTWHHLPVREACKGWPLRAEINKVSHCCCNPQIVLMVANESDTHLCWLSAFSPVAAVIVCDWWKEHTREKKKKKERSKRSVYFHEAEISDYNSGICSIWHWCHCKGSKNTIKLEAKIKKTNKQKITPQSPVLHVSDSSCHTDLSYTGWYEHVWEILQLDLKLCNLHIVWLRICDKKKSLLLPLSLMLILPKDCSLHPHRHQLYNQSAPHEWLLYTLCLENYTLLFCHSVL